MKVWGLAGIIMMGVLAFLIGQRLSADAVGMALGVLFGVLASIPAALLVIASGRRRQDAEFDDEYEVDDYADRRTQRQAGYNAMPSQAPVIIFAPPTAQLPPNFDGMVQPLPSQDQSNGRRSAPQRALTGPTAPPGDGGRAFRVIGEREEWITEW